MRPSEIDIVGAAALGMIWTHPTQGSREQIAATHQKKIAAAALVCSVWIFLHRGEQDSDQPPQPLAGLGATGTEIANVSVAGAGALVSGMISTSAAASMAAGTAIAISTSWIPVIGAAVLAVTFALSAIAKRNMQKTASTHVADEIETQLKANVQAYMSGPRNQISQAAALANFDASWRFVLSPNGCGAPALGSAGKRCISERQQGANPPWAICQPNCPNWFTLYRDPIATDPAATPAPATSLVSSILPNLTQAQMDSLTWVLPVALIALVTLL